MDLILNPGQEEPTYKSFNGSVMSALHEMESPKRTPLSIEDIMRARLEHGRGLEGWSVRFNTSDAIVYHPDGRIKIVLDSEDLKNVNEHSHFIGGLLALPDGSYDSLDGLEFSPEKVKDYSKRREDQYLGSQTKEGAKSDLIWNAVARDKKLLDDYVDFLFEGVKERSSDEARGMAVYLQDLTNPEKRKDIYSDFVVLNSMNLGYIHGAGNYECSNLGYNYLGFLGDLGFDYMVGKLEQKIKK